MKVWRNKVITGCSFGVIVIKGKQYNSDLIVYPDGHIEDSWYRRKGHSLSLDDIGKLVESKPEVIIAGTGVSGLMRPEVGLDKALLKKGIEFIAQPNQKAMKTYNELSSIKKIGACFHLTC
ncbi:MAG: MTH938/NDUFAF3 family protein [Desulfobacterales bacterium]|nr:MTH938/NDUFAF3 family protein [Desulfobacterales bacterium]